MRGRTTGAAPRGHPHQSALRLTASPWKGEAMQGGGLPPPLVPRCTLSVFCRDGLWPPAGAPTNGEDHVERGTPDTAPPKKGGPCRGGPVWPPVQAPLKRGLSADRLTGGFCYQAVRSPPSFASQMPPSLPLRGPVRTPAPTDRDGSFTWGATTTARPGPCACRGRFPLSGGNVPKEQKG